MNKPIKPKKPHKNDKKPSQNLLIEKWICVDDSNELCLKPATYDTCGYINKYRRDDLYSEYTIDFYDLEKLNKSLGHGFTLRTTTYDGYFDGWIVSWMENNPNYNKELKEYEKRFETYSEKLTKYENEMILYNIWKKEQEIEKLKEKIEKIESR